MIRVKDWDRFQHYGKRSPPWIKLYRDLLHDFHFMRLSAEERWALVGIWLLAARDDGKVPDDLAYLSHHLQVSVTPEMMENMLASGMITLDDASNMLAGASTSASTSARASRGEETEKTDTSKPDGPVIDLWDVFLEELGGSGKQPRLTDKRKQKLRALYDEQLKSEAQPTEAFRRILRAVKKSEHHMGNRSYQMPESLFRDESRRDGWMQKSLQNGSTNGQNWVMLNGRMVSVR